MRREWQISRDDEFVLLASSKFISSNFLQTTVTARKAAAAINAQYLESFTGSAFGESRGRL